MKKLSGILVITTLVLAIFLLSSCSLNLGYPSGAVASNGEDYMTQEEVERLIGNIQQNVTVNAGDTYDVTINSSENGNLLAASKALLSAVSITCKFKVTTVYTPSWFGGQSTSKTETQTSGGSGVIYYLDKDAGDAYVITNYHVVYLQESDSDNGISEDITLYLYGQEYSDYAINAEYIGGSMNYDIAVLKVTGNNVLRESNAIAAAFADSNDTAILDTAIAIGNPEGLGISATVGAVNVESENITMERLDGNGYTTHRVLRIDTAVNGGNSGGGLFNEKGELIGIVNAKIVDSSIDNIAYAIPSNIAKYVTDNIIYYDNMNSNNDSVYRVLVGVTVGISSAGVNYDTETGKILKYEEVIVDSISSGSAADGKLKSGDVIKSITVDGVDYEVTRTFNLIDIMLTARQTSTVVFHVERDGADVDVELDMSTISLTEY